MTSPVVDEPTAPADRSSLRKTVRDMTLSMGLIAGIIFAVLLVTWRPQPDPVRTVDPVPAAQNAAIQVDWPVLLPTVDPTWRATSARFQATPESDDQPVWFNGWVTPDDQYVAVVQSPNATDDFLEEQTIAGVPATDAPTVPGWQPMQSPTNDQRSLVRVEDGLTTIVTGSVDWPTLIAFRDALQPAVRTERR